MSKLIDFAKDDDYNFKRSHKVLLKLSPISLDTVELGYELLAKIPELLGETELYDRYKKALNDWAKSVGLRGNEALELLQKATLIGTPKAEDLTRKAKLALPAAIAFTLRVMLILRLQRDYLVGFAELLRLRTFTSFGTLRLQAETAALIRHMYDHPEVATEWLGTSGDVKGKKFHNKYSQPLYKLIHAWKLDAEYSEASGISQHSRFWGLAPGVLLAHKDRLNPGAVGLAFTDIEDPTILLMWFCRMLRFHAKLLRCVEELFPDIDASVFSSMDRLTFTNQVESLWALFRRRYAELKKRGVDKAFTGEG